MKTVMVLVGVFLLVFPENLLACHESDFDGEELLVGTSFFGGHTGDNKMGRAVSVKENFKMLTGNITQRPLSLPITRLILLQQLQTATGVLPISRSSSTTVCSRSQKRVPKDLDNI